MTGENNPRDRLIVALDVPELKDAQRLVSQLDGAISFYKIGLELMFGGGLELARDLKVQGCSVFLDMKFLDIGATVEKAVANVARLGLDFLTIHGHDRKTMDAATRGAAGSDLKLFAVTVLTSLDQKDLSAQGIVNTTPAQLVLQRAQMAQDAGFDGVIASGHEARAVREALGDDLLIITPGIRLAGSNTNDDQARVMTPKLALSAGANHLVVGRPITKASDPRAAAKQFLAQIARSRDH